MRRVVQKAAGGFSVGLTGCCVELARTCGLRALAGEVNAGLNGRVTCLKERKDMAWKLTDPMFDQEVSRLSSGEESGRWGGAAIKD